MTVNTLAGGDVAIRIVNDLARPSTPGHLFAGINYHPPGDVHIAIICHRAPGKPVLENARTLPYVHSVSSIGRYLNLTFKDTILDLQTKDGYAEEKVAASVEHTSLVPVYPLNIGTFRGSVVGEWSRRALSYLGHDVRGRSWVHDSARQVAVVQTALRSGFQGVTRGSIGKGDHTIGRIFAETLMREEGLSGREARRVAERMFPLGESAVRHPLYADWIKDVLYGWRSTFQMAGIVVDHYDRESTILSDIEWRDILNDARNFDQLALRLPKGAPTIDRLTYLEWSVLYYIFLLRQSRKSVSVIPYRQLNLQVAARDIAIGVERRHPSDLSLIAFGDVYIDGAIDRIKDGRFTAVDRLEQYSGRNVRCLVERILSSRASTHLNLKFPINPVESFAGIAQGDESRILPRCVMLLDELPMILRAALTTGDFTKTMQWTGRAKRARQGVEREVPRVAGELGRAIELFAPFM